MFSCYVCAKSKAGQKPVEVVTGRRNVEYHNEYEVEDDYGNKKTVAVDSTGVEITGRVLACPACAREFYDIPEAAPKTLRKPTPGFEEPLPPKLPLVLFEAFFDNAMDRTLHTSKRAEQDSLVAIPLVKEFVTLNPKFGKPA